MKDSDRIPKEMIDRFNNCGFAVHIDSGWIAAGEYRLRPCQTIGDLRKVLEFFEIESQFDIDGSNY